MCTGHRDYLALEGSVEDVPHALINHERRLPVVACVLIGLGHHPGWGVGDSLIRIRYDVRKFWEDTKDARGTRLCPA